MSDTAPVLPERQSSRTRLIIVAVAAVILIAVAAWLVISKVVKSDDEVVRLGTTDVSQPHWKILQSLAAKKGIKIKIVGFSEYTQPNPALKEKDIDLNSFQHILYLSDHNNHTGDNLQPIGSTLIVPLPLYSEKRKSVREFQKGDQVAIPNDATNQARALFVLQGAGLIKFTGDPRVPTPDDVDSTASTVKVVPVEASQTAALIKELAGVVVNNNFAKDAGLPLSGFVYADDPASVRGQTVHQRLRGPSGGRDQQDLPQDRRALPQP